MATLADLISRTQRRVIDLPPAVQTEVPQLVHSAYRRAQQQHNFQVMKATLSANTVIDQRLLVAKPDDWKEWRDKPYAIDNLGGSWELGIADDMRAILTVYGNQDDGRPFWLLLSDPDMFGAQDINVWPLPDGISDYPDGEYRLNIPYWRYLPNLTQSSDHNWITDNLEEYIVYHATREAFGLDWDEERMLVWTQKAQEEYRLAVHADKINQLSGVDTLVPNWRGYRQRRVTR